MSALIARGLTKLAFKGARRMGSWMKKRKADAGKGWSKRKAARTSRKSKRTSRHGKWKTKRKQRQRNRKQKRKFYLAGHIATKVPTFIAAEGSYKDLFLAYGKMGCPGVVILDIPRTGKVGDPQCVESWKNGAAFSSKYQSRMLEFDAPHVFIFSNQSCEPGIFSIDRLVRIELHDGEWTMASRALADAACPGCVYAVQELV
jgi:hypothetical protein